MQKNYLNSRNLALKQTKFIQTLEGIGDILVYETEHRNKNKTVIQGLKRIENIVKKFVDIQKKDPKKFEQLLLAQEFFELYSKDEEEAKLRLALSPKRYLISFSAAINQILRVHEAAIESKNNEISRFATYRLNRILSYISQTPENNLLVKQLLESLANVTRIAIESQDSSMYASSIHWYFDTVFDKNFNLSYLEEFNRCFFSLVKYIISNNQISLFKALVSFLVDGIYIPSYNSEKIWDYGHLILLSDHKKYNELDKKYKIDSKIEELYNSISELDNKEDLDEWFDKFKEIKKILKLQFNAEQNIEAIEIEKEVTEFVISQFKYDSLLEMVYAISAYCLFRKKFEYIKYLWEYKQPPDSDLSWIGHDIVPNTIDGVTNFYFKKALFERKFYFQEDHHGSEIHYKKYFLLLLAHILQYAKPNIEGKYEQIENYNLPKLNIYRLSDLKHSIDNYIELAKSLEAQTETLGSLGFDIATLDDLFINKLIPFLKSLKIKARKRIKNIESEQHICLKKIGEFKEQVLKGFNEATILRKIFMYYNLYEDITNAECQGKLKRFGINIVDDKAAFFEEWHVSYSNWGINYGRGLALSEDSDLFEKIATHCKVIKENKLEEYLAKFSNLSDAIILLTKATFYTYFKYLKNFKPARYKDTPKLNIRGYVGSYLFQSRYIPIFEISIRKTNGQIVILDKSKLGKLLQYSPLNPAESEKLKKDIFYMNIQEFSENPSLMDSLIKESPEWLKKKGSEVEQRKYLREKVLIKIYERFEFKKHKVVEGYLIKIPDDKHKS